MRENPRPTRHLEHVEPELFGEPVPGSLSGPAWDLEPLPGSPDPPPVVGEPTPSGDTAGPAAPSGAGWLPPPGDVWFARSAEVASATSVDVWPPPPAEVEPATSGGRSWKRPAIVVGGVVVAVLALGIGGLALLGQLRPDDGDTTPAVELADLELPITIPQDLPSAGPSGPSRSAGSEPRRSEAPGTGAVLSPPGESGTHPVPGGTGDDGAQTGTGPSTGGSTGGNTGSSGGSGTPTATAPPPTSAPTSRPTSKPTPEPTPSATGEPTPDPTPTPSVSPTPEPTDTPVSPGTGP